MSRRRLSLKSQVRNKLLDKFEKLECKHYIQLRVYQRLDVRAVARRLNERKIPSPSGSWWDMRTINIIGLEKELGLICSSQLSYEQVMVECREFIDWCKSI